MNFLSRSSTIKTVNSINTIIIKSSERSIFENTDSVFSYYRYYNKLSNSIRKLIRKLHLHLLEINSYGNWKKIIKHCSLIILFDNGVDSVDAITKYIKRKNLKIRLVFWYWNPVKPDDIALKDKNIDEIWTYNRFDARKYGLKYNPQFYHISRPINNTSIDTDMVFVGRDKGREVIVDSLKEKAKTYGLKCDFTIVKTKKDLVKYDDYLECVFKSKCIVDLVSNQECGLTLRPLEALFYKKKLITNYSDIVNYDFYNKENIFIIDKDDMSKLTEFINSPYKEIDENIVNFYSYEKWLERIKNGENIDPWK